jgi:hypothetical protein
MTRWMLNTLPLWALATIIVGGFVAFGLVLLRVMQQKVPELVSSEHGAVGLNAIVSVIGMYGILLAFVILALFESFATAELNAEREASALAQVRRASRALPTDVASEIDSTMTEYIHLVVDREWNLMEDGRSSLAAWAAVDRFYETLRNYEPDTESRVVFYGETVAQLDAVVDARRARTADARKGLPGELLILVFGGALLVVAFLCLGGSSKYRAHAVFVAGVAALVGFNVLLVVLMDHPYSGGISVEPKVFTEGTLADLF